MRRRLLMLFFTLITGVAFSLLLLFRHEVAPLVSRTLAGQSATFSAQPPPLAEVHHLFDLGIVDADGDGQLDLFTANHNYRQALLLATADGQYKDVLTAWGLDQFREFPGWEQAFSTPSLDEPGLYIFWRGDTLMLRAHNLRKVRALSGTVKMLNDIEVKENLGFSVAQRSETNTDSPVSLSIVEFSVETDGRLALGPRSRGVATHIEIDPAFPLAHLFVGHQKVSPTTHTLSPFLRDRHGHAWADINNDGALDVYISRGGVGGMLRRLPSEARDHIRDELLVTGADARFSDLIVDLEFEKKDCSGRHVRWVDYDGDGRLDLFVNCQDRGHSLGTFPKQLWRQLADGSFRDTAEGVGLGLPDRQLIDFVWMDVDGDGEIDLVTSEDRGFFLYRNVRGPFVPEQLYRGDFVRADVEGLSTEVNNYWRFDGKLTVADFDADGDLDVFSSSKRGNVLLLNDGGTLRATDPAALGLPLTSINATWVDYDNDGLPDLHTVPNGIYRQQSDGHFIRTGLLALPQNRYQAAIVHWYDSDNDGRRDLLLALNEDPKAWRWWQAPFRERPREAIWTLSDWRNRTAGGHWLQIEVAGPPRNRQAIGARVTVTTPDGTQAQDVGINDSSFFSQGHYRLYFGIGTATHADRIEVRWTTGHSRTMQHVTADQLLHVDAND